jgi:hypothetical protein
VAVARRIVEAHRKDVDLMVMVSHLGYGDDLVVTAAVPGIDVVLGGHSHSVIATPDTTTGSIVVQSGSMGDWAGRLDVTYDLAGRRISGHRWELSVNIKGNLPESKELQGAIKEVMSHRGGITNLALAQVSKPCGKEEIARVTAEAARVCIGADATLVDMRTIWSTWSEGGLTPQMMLDTYKVEREPAGTPGFNSFYSAKISGADLLALKEAATGDHLLIAPDAISPAKSYVLALQKRTALHPDRFLPSGVKIVTPVYEYEAYMLLELQAINRSNAGLFIDRDLPLR